MVSIMKSLKDFVTSDVLSKFKFDQKQWHILCFVLICFNNFIYNLVFQIVNTLLQLCFVLLNLHKLFGYVSSHFKPMFL